MRDTKRVEFKCCTIKFNRARGLWECTFQGIKANLFDELWLAICNPIGIHIYRVKTPENLNFSKAGAATRHRGHHMFFGGPAHQLNLLEAFNAIEAKMISRAGELVGIVEWEKGLSEPSGSDLVVELGKGYRGHVVESPCGQAGNLTQLVRAVKLGVMAIPLSAALQVKLLSLNELGVLCQTWPLLSRSIGI